MAGGQHGLQVLFCIIGSLEDSCNFSFIVDGGVEVDHGFARDTGVVEDGGTAFPFYAAEKIFSAGLVGSLSVRSDVDALGICVPEGIKKRVGFHLCQHCWRDQGFCEAFPEKMGVGADTVQGVVQLRLQVNGFLLCRVYGIVQILVLDPHQILQRIPLK